MENQHYIDVQLEKNTADIQKMLRNISDEETMSRKYGFA
jgi:hypothetical protein